MRVSKVFNQEGADHGLAAVPIDKITIWTGGVAIVIHHLTNNNEARVHSESVLQHLHNHFAIVVDREVLQVVVIIVLIIGCIVDGEVTRPDWETQDVNTRPAVGGGKQLLYHGVVQFGAPFL
jgi:hypothetical protein